MMFLSRDCSQGHQPHFDFEHDSHHPAAAQFGFDESGYKEWDWDSDAVDDDVLAKKLN